MRNFKEWFSAAELVGIQGLPSSPQGINKKARTQGWEKRNREGVQGGAVEYHYSSLPAETRQALGFLEPIKYEKGNSEQNNTDLQQRITQLENKLLALENKTQGFVSSQPSGGLSNDEWQLVCAFRRCNDDRRVGLLATAEALAIQTEKEQKENSEPFTDRKIV